MGKKRSAADRSEAEKQLRSGFRAVEDQPVPDRLRAHLEALSDTARKDRRA